MDMVLRPWRHYADFDGRSRRGEFWLFKLTFWVPLILLVSIGFAADDLTGSFSDENLGTGTIVAFSLASIFYLAALIPGWALMARRLHDHGKSGWMQLLTFIPYLGIVFVLIFGLIPGDAFENSYGPDPRDPSQASMDELGEMFS